MRNFLPSLALFCFANLLSNVAPTIAVASDQALSQTITETDFEKVVVTRNADDVKGLTRVGDVSATSRKFFGDPTALRATATEDLKKQAAKMGASIVLIQADNFSATPINNVNLIGVAYTASDKAVAPAAAAPAPAVSKGAPGATAAIAEKDFEKVVVTRNAADVKGLARAGDVSATARKFFGDPTALRMTATEDLKKQAAKMGASIVLIQVDDFEATPINNVSLAGVAYFTP